MTHWTDRLYREGADSFARLFDRRFDEAREEVADLLALLAAEHGRDPDDVLDVACGIGRHAVAFAETGRSATGLDFSADFVAEARERAADAGVADRTDFVVGDMRHLGVLTGTFDLVTCFWNSLGYYDRATDVDVLAGMRERTAPDGAVVLGLSNKDYHVRTFESDAVRELDGELHVSRREFDPVTGRQATRIDVFEDADDGYEYRETMAFEPRLYAAVEVRELCADAGFDDVTVHGGFDGGEVTLETPELVVVAQ